MNSPYHSINNTAPMTQIIIGNIDYIANPQKINALFHNSVKDWKAQVEQLFVLAKREKSSIISLYGRISSTNEIDIIEILIEIANKR